MLSKVSLGKTDGFEIEVDSRGWFTAMGSGVVGSGMTLQEALKSAKIKRRKNKVRVSIPFTTSRGRNGVITGVHAGTGSLLVTWEDGEKEQVRSMYDAVERLSDEDVQRVKELREAIRKLEKEKDGIFGKYKDVRTFEVVDRIQKIAEQRQREAEAAEGHVEEPVGPVEVEPGGGVEKTVAGKGLSYTITKEEDGIDPPFEFTKLNASVPRPLRLPEEAN